MAFEKKPAPQEKFVIEYKTEEGKLDARWHYDYSVTRKGPVLVENFNLPQKERKKKVGKEVKD